MVIISIHVGLLNASSLRAHIWTSLYLYPKYLRECLNFSSYSINGEKIFQVLCKCESYPIPLTPPISTTVLQRLITINNFILVCSIFITASVFFEVQVYNMVELYFYKTNVHVSPFFCLLKCNIYAVKYISLNDLMHFYIFVHSCNCYPRPRYRTFPSTQKMPLAFSCNPFFPCLVTVGLILSPMQRYHQNGLSGR